MSQKLRLAGAAAAILLAAACSGENPDASSPSTELVIGVGTEPDHLNPVLGYAPDGSSRIFDGLVRYKADLSLEPALATEVPTPSADGLTYTVDIRPGVTFQDGEPLTAEDVAFTYQKVVDPQVGSELAGDFAMLASIEATDEDTVTFTLAQPYSPFPQRLALGIVPQHLLADVTDWNAAEFNQQPVGSGPYRLASWTAGQSLVFEANPDYWGGAPAVTKVTMSTTTDDQARLARLRAGELDAAVLPPRLAEQFDGADGTSVQHRPSADYRGVMLPQDSPVTGDPAIRRALNLAVDRKAMVDGVLAGAGAPASGPISPALSEYYDEASTWPHDVAAAEQALSDGGWQPGQGGVRSKDGTRAAFTVMYPAGDTLREQLALAFAADARKVGIEVTVDGLSWEAITPRMGSDALVMGYGNPYDPDFTSYQLFHSSFAGQGFFNPGNYRNPDVDAALDEGRAAVDPQARRAAYVRFQQALKDDPPWVFLTYLEHVYVVPDGWTGSDVVQIEPHDHGFTAGPWWNIQDWQQDSEPAS